MRMLMYAGVFFLAMELGRERKRAKVFFWAVILAGTGYALYGLIMHLGGFELVRQEYYKASK